jgi:hypothetical protein
MPQRLGDKAAAVARAAAGQTGPVFIELNAVWVGRPMDATPLERHGDWPQLRGGLLSRGFHRVF